MGGPLEGADPAAGLTVPEGNPDGLESAAQKLLAAADAMTGHEHKILNAGHVPSWIGSASSAYTATVNQTCAAYANQSVDACRGAARAAKTLAHALRAAQEQAREAIARLNAMAGDAQSISAQYDALSSLKPEAQPGRAKLLGMMVAEFNAEAAALRAQVADAHTQAREAAAVAAGSFGDAAGMAPSIVARRTERIMTQVAHGDYSGLERIGDLNYLSVRAQEEIAGSLANDVTRNLNELRGLDEFRDMSAVVSRFKLDEEFSTAFYNAMGGAEASTIHRDASWYFDEGGFDNPELIDLVAPFAVMLGTATRSGALSQDFTNDFLQRDLPLNERDHLGIGKFLLSNGQYTQFGAAFLSEAAQDLVVEHPPNDMDGNNPYLAPPVDILKLVANNPEASGLLLTGKSTDGMDNLTHLLLRGPYWPDDGQAVGDVIYAGAHTLRFYGDDGVKLANDVAGRVIVTVPEFSDHLADGMRPALVTVLDDHIVDFEYAAMERAMPDIMGPGDVEVRVTYEQGSEYLEVLFGDDVTREATSRVIGERVADNVYSAAFGNDTVFANRAGALAEMGVLSAGEADLDHAQAEATANALKQFAAGKLVGLTPADKVPGFSELADLAFEEMFPTDQVEKALEEQGAVQINELQGLRGLVVATKVELGQLPPEAAGMVDPVDGSVNPDFVGRSGDDDTLRWDLDGDGVMETVTERHVYDASGHELSGSAYDAALNLANFDYSEAHPPALDEVPLPKGYSFGSGLEQNPNAWDYLWDGIIDEGIVDPSNGYVVATKDDLNWDPNEHVYRLTLHDPDDPDVTIALKRENGNEWVRVEKRGDDWVPVGGG